MTGQGGAALPWAALGAAFLAIVVGTLQPGVEASIGSCEPGRAGSQGRGPDEDRSGDDLIPYRKRRRMQRKSAAFP